MLQGLRAWLDVLGRSLEKWEKLVLHILKDLLRSLALILWVLISKSFLAVCSYQLQHA